MGVRGLGKFVKERVITKRLNLATAADQHRRQHHQPLHLVLDGDSLYHYLYDQCGADRLAGGEYHAYAEYVKVRCSF